MAGAVDPTLAHRQLPPPDSHTRNWWQWSCKIRVVALHSRHDTVRGPGRVPYSLRADKSASILEPLRLRRWDFRVAGELVVERPPGRHQDELIDVGLREKRILLAPETNLAEELIKPLRDPASPDDLAV